jgi:hypothetical protein
MGRHLGLVAEALASGALGELSGSVLQLYEHWVDMAALCASATGTNQRILVMSDGAQLYILPEGEPPSPLPWCRPTDHTAPRPPPPPLPPPTACRRLPGPVQAAPAGGSGG